ncbi:unnamed protein product, partial [Rotaria sp. Silwood1]
QRRVRINKKYLLSSSSSPITNSTISPHTFNLWYSNKKKKNISNGQDYVIK